MKVHRFYIRQKDLIEKVIINKKLDGDLFNQMNNVLKFKIGETVCLFNEDSEYNFFYKIENKDNKDIILSFINKEINKIETEIKNKNKVILFISNIKKDNLELTISKIVEIGAYGACVIMSERSQNKVLNVERLEKIIIEATEQCGRNGLLKINPEIVTLKKALENIDKNEVNLFCNISNDNQNNKNLSKLNTNKENISNVINIFVGPEGGWSEEEVKLFTLNKFIPISLGACVLRAETAAIVSVSKFVK